MKRPEIKPDNTELINKINELELKVEDNVKTFNEAAKRLDSLEVKLDKQYEKIDTLSSVGVPADITDFKLRATKPAPRFN